MLNTLDRMAMIAETKKVTINVHGAGGNIARLLGECRASMWQLGIQQETINTFMTEVCAGDYTNALQTVDLWVTLVNIAPSGTSGSLIGSLCRIGLAPKLQEELCWRGWD